MATRRKTAKQGRGEEAWRWTLRVLGVLLLLTLLVLFAAGREINAVWLFLDGGLLGLDALGGAIKERR